VPDKHATRKIVQRKRNEILDAPANPENLHNLVIPDIFRFYSPGGGGNPEPFLLSDNGDENRILLFGRHSHQQWAGKMSQIFVDGTFSISPPLFNQVFLPLFISFNHVY
jgi:hypothetical protein